MLRRSLLNKDIKKRFWSGAMVVVVFLLSVTLMLPCPASARAKELVIAQKRLGDTFLPWLKSAGRSRYYYPLYDALGEFDVDKWIKKPGTWEMKPSVLTEWEVSSDRSRLHFRVRKGIEFHDGWGPLTAEDVVFLVNKVVNHPLTGRPRWKKVGNVKARVLGPYEGEITSKPGFLDRWFVLRDLMDLYGAIPSKKYVETVGEEKANRVPIGSGALKFAKTAPDLVEYEAVRDHWRVVPPYDKLRTMKVREVATRMAMVRAGQAHIAIDMPGGQVEEAKKAGLQVIKIPAIGSVIANFGGMILDDADPRYDPTKQGVDPWANPKVRQAMVLAVDVQGLIGALTAGYGSRVPFTHLFPQSSDWEPMPYDLGRARELLVEAGYPDGFPLKIFGGDKPGVPGGRYIAEALAMMWEKIGLKSTVVPMEWTTFREKYLDPGRSAGFIYFDAPEAMPDPWAHYAYYLPQPEAITPYQPYLDKKLTALIHGIEAARLKENPAAIDAAERAALNYMYEQKVAIPLFSVPMFHIAAPNISWKPKPWFNRGYEYINLK